MVYAGCQDILYTWTFRSVFDGAFAESAEGARRATVADFAKRGARLRLGFVLIEPAGYVQHFGDVVAGAAADAVWFFRNAYQDRIEVEKL